MAGGSGTRFWPRSRRRTPKQLLHVTGARTLLQTTADRLARFVDPARMLVVTHRDHAAAVRRQLPEIGTRNVLVEPLGCNTAPCLALAALEIAARDRDATFFTVPADHAIADPRAFQATVLEALGWARHAASAVTIGIEPTAPETGFGYIRVGEAIGGRTHRVRAFVEKPSLARARRFVASGEYLWNSGMFAWRVATVLDLLDRHLPAMMVQLRRAVGTPRPRRTAAIARAYRAIAPISIDHGVMEKADDVLVVRGAFGWNDIGSWAALADLAGRDGRPVVAIDAARYVVSSPDRLVALVGVDDLIVVDAPDALLICHRERAQDVRRVVQELERRGLHGYL
jgi:mannose-1-phosphate guanylyltransferase